MLRGPGCVCRSCWMLLLMASIVPSANAQMSGEIEGTVADSQGLAVPGVTVTLAGEALITPQVAVTLSDGSYRFRALGRGAYDVTVALPGFRTVVREGVIVEGNRVIRIDAALELVEVAETITVTGDAPVVDARTTALVNDFGVAELQEVPSATDVWAVLGQTAGVRMRGFDVGGSHKSQQTSYESFGVRDQNRVLADGVDTTEGEGGTGFYFDYYSIEEFTTTAAGNDVEMTAPGTPVMMTMKSGGNRAVGRTPVFSESTSRVPARACRSFLTDLSANRSENVTMVDVRLDKALAVGLRGRLTLMLDVYNLLNANAVTNFSLRAGDGERVIAALDPIAMKVGVRIQF